MARKNNRRSKRPAKPKLTERIFWSTTDRLQLLAYLDWCVQYTIKFELTAPGHLENATGKHFSKERIHKKLYKEWQMYGICDKFSDLFELGTAGFSPLVGEEEENFHEIFRSINPAREARRTRSRSLGLAARSGTLSAPHSTYSISSSREPNGLSTSQPGNSNVVPERTRQKARANSSFGPTRPASTNDPSEDELATNYTTDRVKGEDEFELSTIVSPELSNTEHELAPAIPNSQEGAVTVTLQAQLGSSMEASLRQAKADLLKQKSYCVTLENRMSEIRRRNHDLEHCISLASSVHGTCGEEARFREVISTLKDKLDRHRLLMRNYEELEADSLGFLNTSLRAEYDKLYSNVRDTSATICHLTPDDTLPEQRTGFSHLANNWAKRISGRDLGSLLSHCEASQIPKKVILASLLVAGLFELVLEEVFPAFLAADSPLLDQYRKHIETQSKNAILFILRLTHCPKAELTRPGGWNALQRLDFISIKSLFSDKNIEKKIISETSKRLSSLMMQNLSCFLPLENRDITQRLPHNELETETIGDMNSTLYHALKVKIKLMMSVKRLKYLFFRPRTLFDGEKMEVVRSQAEYSALLGQEVKICLLPALFTTSEAGDGTGVRDEYSFRSDHAKALVEVMDEDIASLVLVEKAIVFL